MSDSLGIDSDSVEDDTNVNNVNVIQLEGTAEEFQSIPVGVGFKKDTNLSIYLTY